MKTCYVVVSPVMTYEEPIPGLPGGPLYDAVDHAFIWARTRRDARRAAVRLWERRCSGRKYNACCWPHTARSDELNPFSGVKVREMTDADA